MAAQFDSERFKEANRGYLDRIEKLGLKAVYDATLDTLFLEIGGPRVALSEHMLDNILARVDPISLEIVGLEILDFMDDFLPANRLLGEALRDWRLERDTDSEWTLMEPLYAPIRHVVEAATGSTNFSSSALSC